MSKFDEPLKIEVMGNAIVIDPIVPDSIHEKKMKEMGQKTIKAPDPKNRFWDDGVARSKVSDYDEHPMQGIVKAISEQASKDLMIDGLKINDRIACRIGAGEPLIYKDKVYFRLAPHEIMFRYMGSER